MNIVLLEPFYTGSHASWAEGLAAHSRHRVEILKLSGSHWKWRMHGGAVTLAERFLEGGYRPDLLLATDMLDMGAFLALTRKVTAGIPTATYFHENQLTYPWSPKDRDKRRAWDRHYSFINFVSALTSDRVFFNSRYHMNSFLEALPVFLRQFPDHQELDQVAVIRRKCEVLPLGFDLNSLDAAGDRQAAGGAKNPRPLVLWNHRWEYDKNPGDFFAALRVVAGRGRSFDVALRTGRAHRPFGVRRKPL
jgi:glycosyltransferase involved in cell wall biosynthesis